MMSEKEFTDIAAELRVAAVRSAAAAGIGVEGAEDVAQDIMLRLWTLRDNISSARHARGLAVVAARNRALDMLRQSHTVSLTTGVTVVQSSSAADVAIEDDAWLQRRLQALPPMQHQVLRLRQIELKDNAEIAAILGIKPASVATLLSKARRQLLADIRKRNQRT